MQTLTTMLPVKKLVAIGCLSALLQGCLVDDSSEPSHNTAFDFLAMLANLADNQIIPLYDDAALKLDDLASDNGSLNAYCEGLGSASEAELLATARADWSNLAQSWQAAELTILGPLADNDRALRNRIHNFNSAAPFNRCAVDQAVVLAQEPGFDLSQRSTTHRGLPALEYLLFDETLTHACPSGVTQTQDWNARSEDDRKQQRCQFAQTVAEDLQLSLNTLVNAWDENGGAYRTTFVSSDNTAATIEALSDALFYLELEVKDAKIGTPAGIHNNCSSTSCPDAVEAPFSRQSLEHVRTNLTTFKNLYSGGEGLGFDDLISHEGFADEAQAFIDMSDAALQLLDSMETDLFSAVSAIDNNSAAAACANAQANPDTSSDYPVCQLHGLLKRITDSLRTDFITIVNLDLPDRAQSDGD